MPNNITDEYLNNSYRSRRTVESTPEAPGTCAEGGFGLAPFGLPLPWISAELNAQFRGFLGAF
jgi:hypothetical protein